MTAGCLHQREGWPGPEGGDAAGCAAAAAVGRGGRRCKQQSASGRTARATAASHEAPWERVQCTSEAAGPGRCSALCLSMHAQRMPNSHNSPQICPWQRLKPFHVTCCMTGLLAGMSGCIRLV